MKVYRILVSSGGELPEIVLPAPARAPAHMTHLFSVFGEPNVEVLSLTG